MGTDIYICAHFFFVKQSSHIYLTKIYNKFNSSIQQIKGKLYQNDTQTLLVQKQHLFFPKWVHHSNSVICKINFKGNKIICCCELLPSLLGSEYSVDLFLHSVEGHCPIIFFFLTIPRGNCSLFHNCMIAPQCSSSILGYYQESKWHPNSCVVVCFNLNLDLLSCFILN